MWGAFFCIDCIVTAHLAAGNILHFLALRSGALLVATLVLLHLRRSPTPSERTYAIADGLCYCAATVALAVMCAEFRGIASPYVSGFCVVLLSRTVVAQDHWKRGLLMNGLPVALFFIVLLGSALVSLPIAAQLHDPAAVTTLMLSASYVVGTFVLLVVNGHIVWTLRRQVFEARNLGRYRLKRQLASGGMGDVWVAYHAALRRDVAIKILRPEERERSASALSRFEREVRSTAELTHPNTVRVFDYGITEDGLCYYVMELLEGETLAQHVSHFGPLSPARAVHIIGQAARALGEAHERGIVHRDIKPENLFLTCIGGEPDFVKVIDFGIAKVQRADVTMTGTDWVLGTPAYISPEVAMGKVADLRSDVYALGAVLYFLLCGLPPFEAENSGALAFAHINERPLPPSSKLGRALPPDIEAAVMKALAKNPAERFATAAEFAFALAACSVPGRWGFGNTQQPARHSSHPPRSEATTQTHLSPPKAPKSPGDEPRGSSVVSTLPSKSKRPMITPAASRA
jgi:serine/threonine-protein kinase